MEGPPIRVYLIAASHLAEEAVSALLSAHRGLVLAGTTGSTADAARQLEALPEPADVVLIDAAAEREGLSALALTRELGERPGLRLLPLGLAGEGEALRFLEAGAAGTTLKSDSAEQVMAAIVGVAKGRAPCTPRLAAKVFARLAELSRRRVADGPALDRQLSRREEQVLALLAVGLCNKEIARRLGIALSTAANHVQKILSKLGVRRRHDAVRHAYRRGLLDRSLAAARA